MGDPEEVKKEVVIRGTKKGLGIRIVGGRTVQFGADGESYFGIFIKEVIKDSLAEKEGTLKRGDQLLEANGQNLVGVSNERAVEVLKSCASTNKITLIISRDSKSQLDFRRLSNSLLLKSTDPKATSTPIRSAQPVVDVGARQNGYHDGKDSNDDEARRFSTSSELTQVSTTDISSHGDDLDQNELIDQVALNKNLQRHTSEQSQKSIALSDVVLEEATASGVRQVDINETALSFLPPPVPTSPPPSLETEEDRPSKWTLRPADVALSATAPDVVLRDRASPEGKAMSPPLSASLSTSITVPYISHTFVFPKTAGLGVIIGGGEGKPDGPYIIVDKILDGMDAAKDGNMKQGDRIISINGGDFRNLKREKALTLLSQIKTNRSISSYNITVERKLGDKQDSSGPPAFLPPPQRNSNSAIFNSDTLLASEVKSSHIESFTSDGASPSKKSTPLRYLAKRESGRRKDKAKHDSSIHNRLSMDPVARCKLSKLEWALKYMGYTITPQQQKEMRLSLDIDESGRVMFIEFVKLAQEMFAFKLDDTHLETNLMLALTHKEDLDMPPMPRKSTSYEHIWDQGLKESLMKPAASQPILPLASSSNSIHSESELEHMRQTLHEMGRDKEKMMVESALEKEKKLTAQLKEELKHKEEELSRAKKALAHDISTVSKDDEEVLLKRIEMTEGAHKAERDRSNLMEDEMRKLTAELQVLRTHQPDMSLDDLRRRLAIIDNELNKEKSMSRRYQVATERLMQFVENCHEVLVKSPEVDRIMYHPHGKGSSVQRGNVVTGNPRPPQYLSKHARFTASKLATEAKETMDAVRKLMEADVLPINWQEAYTEDGRKYYLNHETQVTSWVHPVTKVASSHSRSASRSSTQSLPSAPITPVHTHP